MENAWSTMPDRIPGLLKQWGQYSRSTEQDDPWSMVAFGDRKDFLQVLRMVHFRRKCTMRKTCKRDTERREVCSFMVSPPSKQFRIRFPLRAVPLSGSDLLIKSRHGNS